MQTFKLLSIFFCISVFICRLNMLGGNLKSNCPFVLCYLYRVFSKENIEAREFSCTNVSPILTAVPRV